MNYEERDPNGIYKSNTLSDTGSEALRGSGPDLLGINTLIGNNVCNLAGESLGDIKEIMLDIRSGKVSYAVLSFGGFLGMGEKLFAVPWGVMTLDTNNKCFVLNVEKDRLKKAPGFDKDQWPDMASQAWTKEIHSFYGATPHHYDAKN